MKEAVMKVIDTLTQEDSHGAFQKLLERYYKCIAAGGDYFEGDKSFMSVLSIKVPIQKKSGNLSYAPHISAINSCIYNKIYFKITWYNTYNWDIYIYIYIYSTPTFCKLVNIDRGKYFLN